MSALRGLYSAGLSSDNFRFSSLILSPPLSVKAASRNETANFFLISWGEKPGLPRPAWLFRSWKYLLIFARVCLRAALSSWLPCALFLRLGCAWCALPASPSLPQRLRLRLSCLVLRGCLASVLPCYRAPLSCVCSIYFPLCYVWLCLGVCIIIGLYIPAIIWGCI